MNFTQFNAAWAGPILHFYTVLYFVDKKKRAHASESNLICNDHTSIFQLLLQMILGVDYSGVR